MRTTTRVLAVSSGGGHWIELMRVMPAFDGADVAFITVNREYRSEVPGQRFYAVNDATRWNKFAAVLMAVRVLLVVLRERPDVIITTGAAPGYFAMRFGRWLGARTIWLDSIANVEEMSMSGRISSRFADLWLTQWPHLASLQPSGQRAPEYAGGVL